MDVTIIKPGQREYVAGAMMAVLLGKIQTAPLAETVALSGELMKWYRVMWPLGHSPVCHHEKTRELVEELSRREGVEMKIAEPCQDVELKVSGPAVALVITD